MSDEGLYFASEAKSLLKMIGKKFSLNYQVIGEFLLQSQMNISNNYFLKNIYQIPANSIIHFSFSDKLTKQLPMKYWDIPAEDSSKIVSNNLIETIREKFFNAVKQLTNVQVDFNSPGRDQKILPSCSNIILE